MRILIVDDDDSIRDYLIIVLENLLDSLDIIECTSSQEALKL
ncbi:MAG: DNA-binding response regulator, partial [Bdellovibrio sp. CG_4_9_14_3_um_filter_39_7]